MIITDNNIDTSPLVSSIRSDKSIMYNYNLTKSERSIHSRKLKRVKRFRKPVKNNKISYLNDKLNFK
jgi:hypothetical protein